MYHDQGQIAMKLMGFDRGVTMLGGFPFAICTPAHGTAYDIAGKGSSPSVDPLKHAFVLQCFTYARAYDLIVLLHDSRRRHRIG